MSEASFSVGLRYVSPDSVSIYLSSAAAVESGVEIQSVAAGDIFRETPFRNLDVAGVGTDKIPASAFCR